jgi:hypothetical protein
MRVIQKEANKNMRDLKSKAVPLHAMEALGGRDLINKKENNHVNQ